MKLVGMCDVRVGMKYFSSKEEKKNQRQQEEFISGQLEYEDI